jgi:hypothetical protein
MAEMDKVVQQNASGAGETASASVKMRAQAETMETMKGYVAELTALVGGVGNGNGVFPGKALKRRVLRNKSGSDLRRSPAIGSGIVPPAPARKTAGRGKERAVLDSQKARPDQVIPLGDAALLRIECPGSAEYARG